MDKRQAAIEELRLNGELSDRLEHLLALEEEGKISRDEVNAEFKKEARREMAKEKHGQRSEILRHAARTGKNTAVGIASIADIPNLAALGLYAAGLRDKPKFYESRAEKLANYIDRKSDDYTHPHSDNEEIADTATQAIATLPGLQAAGIAAKAAKLAKLGKGLKSTGSFKPASVSSAAAAGAASEKVSQDHPDKPLMSLLASIGAGAGTSGAINKLGRAGKINKEALRAFTEADIPFGWGDIVQDRATQVEMMKLPTQLGAGRVMEKHTSGQRRGVKKGLGDIESKAFKEGKREAIAVKGAENTLGQKKAQHSRRYDKHAENIKKLPDSDIEMNNVYEWLDSLSPEMKAEALKGNSKTAKFLRNFLKIGDDIPEIDYSQPLHKIMAQVDGKKNVPKLSNEMHTHKTSEIGKHVKTDKAQKNYTEAELAHLYGLMKEDQKSIGDRLLKHVGKDAHENWRRMGGMYKDYVVEEAPHLNKMLENAKKTDSGRYSSVGREYDINKNIMTDVKGEAKGVKFILDGLESPKERAGFVKSIMEQLGQRGGEFNYNVLQTEFDKLSSPAKKILLRGLGEEKDKFKESLIAVRRLKKVQGEGNPSGTAKHLSKRQILNSIKNYGHAKYLTSPKVVEWKMESREKGAKSKALLEGALRGLIG